MEPKSENKKRGNTPIEDVISKNNEGNKKERSRSLILASKEVCTSRDYAILMAALLTDVIGGKVSPTIVNAACNAGRQLVKMAELNLKYGTKQTPSINLLTGQQS